MLPSMCTTHTKPPKTCGVISEDPVYGIKKDRGTRGTDRSGNPYHEPYIHRHLQDTDRSENQKRNHHQSSSRAPRNVPRRQPESFLNAAVEAGAPEEIIGWIDVPSLELTNKVMQDADLILATGGPGMVKAAYSSGKPAIGVGPGNTPAIIDEIRGRPYGGQLRHSLKDL